MVDDYRQQLLADIKSSRNDTLFSDLIITCGTNSYNVHRVVVASRSVVFRKALEFPGKESEQGIIDLSDNDPAIVDLLLQYIYEAEYDPILAAPPAGHSCSQYINGHVCGDYGERCICDHHTCGEDCNYNCEDFVCSDCVELKGDSSQLLTHAKMFEMADKYVVSGLKQLCIEKYKQACLKFWDDSKFAESAYHAYSTTPTREKGLRNVVCKVISQHMSLLKKPEVEDLMNEFNGLAFGLLFEKAEQAGWCK
ncbi:hypothetical protein E8E13_011610 [Curvularia kusanoi]|uniref:BTB domain-containing protein n=1 Tax=Curvularia kusanoi TaxID=90978 RepID=A0A9P4TQY2_CURKU|nr:hypothetical protein E8E13_011610 [Curvularia kusanoi]